jgi:hypothetical protein
VAIFTTSRCTSCAALPVGQGQRLLSGEDATLVSCAPTATELEHDPVPSDSWPLSPQTPFSGLLPNSSFWQARSEPLRRLLPQPLPLSCIDVHDLRNIPEHERILGVVLDRRSGIVEASCPALLIAGALVFSFTAVAISKLRRVLRSEGFAFSPIIDWLHLCTFF